MTVRLIFAPPQLPNLSSGDEFITHVVSDHPQLTIADESLRRIAFETDNYNRLRHEYDRRNAHYADWIHWGNENPNGKEQLLAFLNDHRNCFDVSREVLDRIDAVLAESPELSNLGGLRQTLRDLRERARANAHTLSENIDTINAPEASAPGVQVLPQKRTHGDNP